MNDCTLQLQVVCVVAGASVAVGQTSACLVQWSIKTGLVQHCHTV
jgi:hypothetical protein